MIKIKGKKILSVGENYKFSCKNEFKQKPTKTIKTFVEDDQEKLTMDDIEDYYKLLNVSRSDISQIKDNYRLQIIKYHPDRHYNTKDANTLFLAIKKGCFIDKSVCYFT